MTRLALLALLTLPAVAVAQNPATVTFVGGKTAETNVVVSVPAPAGLTGPLVVSLSKVGAVAAQVVPPDLLNSDEKPQLQFIVPSIQAGESVTGTVTQNVKPQEKNFHFEAKKGEYLDLMYGDRKVLRSINMPHDPTDKKTHELTFKPFHHVFDPATGTVLLTNGAGLASDKANLFPHHRGVFMGWMKVTYGANKTADVWHGRNGEFTEYVKTVSTEAGPDVGRERAQINWHGKDGLLFAEETREVEAFATPGGTLIEFASLITTKMPKVTLDGDPQHAGFHFRAAMETAKQHAKETYYLRPDGKDEKGKTRNWEPKSKKGPVNLPWDAMSFLVGEKRYTVVYLDRPENPKEARFSERDYGRFGSYFVYDITPKTPLKVKYRLWVQEGEMTVAQCENLSRGFTDPPHAAK
jgi:hypothetical protein